tara:strand:+ start:419 stop:568 length:150 start_codon:yes stop_codon:yes gene_type:complete
MNQNSTSNNINTNEFTSNNDEIDYKNLINVLKEISKKIALLEKNNLDKF